MKNEYIQDDIIEVVGRIVEDKLRYYRRYIGQVRTIKPDGTITAHLPDFPTDPTDPKSWLTVLPASKLKNSLRPAVMDYVEIYFRDGTPDTPRYTFTPAEYHTSFVEGLLKQVLFENSLTQYILFDSATGELKLNMGVIPAEKMVLGETLKSKLETLIDTLKDLIDTINAMTVTGVTAGAGTSGVPSNTAAFTTIKNSLTAQKTALSTILSLRIKNN